MGLHVSTLKELPDGERSLYIYLLDYGWPAGAYEQIFLKISERYLNVPRKPNRSYLRAARGSTSPTRYLVGILSWAMKLKTCFLPC
jgi:hypothetical protein